MTNNDQNDLNDAAFRFAIRPCKHVPGFYELVLEQRIAGEIHQTRVATAVTDTVAFVLAQGANMHIRHVLAGGAADPVLLEGVALMCAAQLSLAQKGKTEIGVEPTPTIFNGAPNNTKH